MTKKLTVRDKWYWQIAGNKKINLACRELMTHLLLVHMDDKGHIKVKREALAAELNVHPQRITDRIAEAIKAGLLAKTGGGVNGQESRYVAVLLSGNQGAVTSANRRTVTSIDPGNGRAVTSERLPEPGEMGEPGNGRAVPIRARVTYGTRQDQPTPVDGHVSPTESAGSEQRSCETNGQPTPPSLLASGSDAEVVRESGTALARRAAQLAAENGGDPAAMKRVLVRIAACRGVDPDAEELLADDPDVEDAQRRAALDEVTRRRAERKRQEAGR